MSNIEEILGDQADRPPIDLREGRVMNFFHSLRLSEDDRKVPVVAYAVAACIGVLATGAIAAELLINTASQIVRDTQA
jgi:hypothetical protein